MAGEPQRAEALAVATRALAKRDFSKDDLRERLHRAGIAPAAAGEALKALQRAGVIDDRRFAADRARALAERGQGDRAIRFDLERRGIDGDEIEAALAELEPERERAARVAARRGRSLATARLLARRGFDEDVAAAAVASDA
jgi:regulatory protein